MCSWKKHIFDFTKSFQDIKVKADFGDARLQLTQWLENKSDKKKNTYLWIQFLREGGKAK